MSFRIRRSFAFVILLLALAACVGPKEGHVARQWSLALRELGLNPVFPPREDVQVGDVYVHPVEPGTEDEVFEADGFLPLALWVDHLDVNQDLETFYAARTSLPRTNAAGGAVPGSAHMFTTGDATRLRRVGFPVFMTATFAEGSLGGLIPAEAVGVALGLSGHKASAITVRIPEAESIGLPAEMLRRKLFPSAVDAEGNPVAPTDSLYTQAALLWQYGANQSQAELEPAAVPAPTARADAVDPADPADGEAGAAAGLAAPGESDARWFVVITEVYYARVIDLSIATETAVGADVGVKPAVPVSGARNAIVDAARGASADDDAAEEGEDADADAAAADTYAAAAGDDTDAAGDDGDAEAIAADDDEALNAVALANSLNAELDELSSATDIGIDLKFVSVGQSAISMRATYDRPVAIGYRGLYLKVARDALGVISGPVLAGSVSTTVPTKGDRAPVDPDVAPAPQP